MRSLGLIDLLTAARALSAVPRYRWSTLARAMVAEAHEADARRLKSGQGHPKFGNGTLEGAARGHALSEGADLSSPGFREALLAVLLSINEAERCGLAACAGNALGRRRIEVEPFE